MSQNQQSPLSPASAGRGLKVALTLGAMAVYAAVLLWFGLPGSAPVSAPVAGVASPAPNPVTPVADGSAVTPQAGAASSPAAATPPQGNAAVPEPAKPDAAVAAGNAVPPPVTTAFDIVRVQPSGEMLVAGRAAPDAVVELMRNGTRHARVVADASGLFVITEPALPPGPGDLSLRLTLPDGRQILSLQTVTVVVSPDGKEPPLVALAAPGVPTVTLSQPRAEPPAAAQAQAPVKAAPSGTVSAAPNVAATPAVPATPEAVAPRTSIAILSVEIGEAGRMFVSARAASQASIRLYLNEAYLASALADTSGLAAFTIEKGLAPGDYRVRLDDVDPVTGAVRTRAEAPFVVPASIPSPLASTPAPVMAPVAPPLAEVARPAGTGIIASAPENAASTAPAAPASAPPAPALTAAAPVTAASASAASASPPPAAPQPVIVPEVRTTVVVRGDNLWRISRKLYGEGLRYSVIYGANQDQIRDPDLIYPGQVFVTPKP